MFTWLDLGIPRPLQNPNDFSSMFTLQLHTYVWMQPLGADLGHSSITTCGHLGCHILRPSCHAPCPSWKHLRSMFLAYEVRTVIDKNHLIALDHRLQFDCAIYYDVVIHFFKLISCGYFQILSFRMFRCYYY